MPRVNIYIRNEDEAKWQAIADKPEWLHEHLNLLRGMDVTNEVAYKPEPKWLTAQKAKEREELARIMDTRPGVLKEADLNKVLEDMKDMPETPQKVIVPRSVLCEHFQPKGQCMVKGCKYGR